LMLFVGINDEFSRIVIGRCEVWLFLALFFVVPASRSQSQLIH